MQEYSLDFELTGASVPINKILSALPRGFRCETWRVGEPVTRKRAATTAGLRIAIAGRVEKEAAEKLLERFFIRYAAFLKSLSRLRTNGDEQFVRCIMCVYPENASYLELSERVLNALAKTRTTFVVAAWPCDAPWSFEGKEHL